MLAQLPVCLTDVLILFRQLLKFSVFDWRKPSRDPLEQESLGSMECSLAEAIATKGTVYILGQYKLLATLM